jgi:L-ascorbate metabolism protein UlaG (beta-lactamase superfamily)
MKITWLGHSAFRIEIEDQVLLIDPWLDGNPMMPQDRKDEAVKGATQILVTHGHFDHTGGVVELSKALNVPVAGMVELAGLLGAQGIETTGFNKGGTIQVGGVSVSMVTAAHSSSIEIDGKHYYAGDPTGFVIRGEDTSVYVSGDTDVMAEMGMIGARYAPSVGILCAGGFYTMDMEGAAWAAREYFDFDTVIPCHYKTFPLLEQSAEKLAKGLPRVTVAEPEVMKAIEL